MWKHSTKTGTLLLLSGLLALSNVGCSSDSSENSPSSSSTPSAKASVSSSASPSARLSPVLKPKLSRPPKVAASPTEKAADNSGAYDRAIDLAAGASTISKSAVSRDDWKLVANSWQQAINLLKQVPASSPQHAIAQKKLPQYQRFLGEAKEKAAPPIKKITQGDINPQFFSIPIKGRRGGTPIIDVMFNGSRTFEMLFDTGANVTLIPQQIAYSLQLKPQGATRVTVADGADIIVSKTIIKSLEIDGRIRRNMPVVVAPPAMEEGLLGQDFYEGYDVSIKENIIEFRKH